MSDAGTLLREPNDSSLGGAAVDQSARNTQTDVERVVTDTEVIEDLKRQLAEKEERISQEATETQRARARADAEASARADAEARARDAERLRQDAHVNSERSMARTQLDSLASTIESAHGQMANLKTAMVAANEAGDFAKAADIQADMALLGAKMVTLETGKAALEERVKTPEPGADGRNVPGGGNEAPRQLTPSEQRVEFIQKQPPIVQAWLRGPHGERFFNDTEFRNQVAAAARDAGAIYNINSQQYLDHVEEKVGLRQPAGAAAGGGAPPGGGRDPSGDGRMVSAPAGGASGGSVRTAPGGATEVSLSREEIEMAHRQGLSPGEYARYKKQLKDEGLIGPGAGYR